MPRARYPTNSNRAELGGIDRLSVSNKATLVFSHPSVPGSLYVHSGANAIEWSYDLNTQTTPTIGGEVTQILSCLVGPMTISGQTAGLRTDIEGSPRPKQTGYSTAESYNPNDELKNIVDWFLTYMHAAGTTGKGSRLRDERAILFQYPERQWDFYIQVTSLDGFTYDKTVYAPEWSITAEVVSDNALNFFRGITMNNFTDNLTNRKLLSGFSFAGGVADTNKNFGQDGSGGKNPFLNPAISASASEVAKRMGNNFQALVAAWSTADFANFGFNALLNEGAKPIDIDAAYMSLFGTTYLGNLPGYSGVGSGVGSYTYTVKSGVQAPPWVAAVLKKGGWDTTTENLAWMAGWGRKEGSDQPRQMNGNNWMNTTRGYDKYPGFISSNGATISKFPTFEIGVTYTLETITKGNSGAGYPDIEAALKSGNPYTNPPLEGLQTWVAGSGRTQDSMAYALEVMAMNADVVKGQASSTDQAGQVKPKQGFNSLHPILWTAYSIGRRAPYAFGDSGTYAGKAEDHSWGDRNGQPGVSMAIDLGFSPATGQDNVLAKQYFDIMVGRPEVEYVILGDKIWSKTRGLHDYTRNRTHFYHVHVSGVHPPGSVD